MARNDRAPDPEEARLIRRMRFVAAIVVGLLLAISVLVDEFGRLLVDPTFHVSEFLIGSLTGAFLLVFGVTSVTSVSLPGGWVVRKPPPPAPPGVGETEPTLREEGK